MPFGEYIPWRGQACSTSNFGQLALVPRDMLSGTRTEPLTIAGVPVADAICFDVAYDDGDPRPGRATAPELLVVQTSNAMFIHTDQIDQQFAITRLRAIETGRTVVVAATNGLTGVIDARRQGRRQRRAPHPGGAGRRASRWTPASRPAVRLGPWLGRGAVAATLVLLLLGILRRPRRAAERLLARRTAAPGTPA